MIVFQIFVFVATVALLVGAKVWWGAVEQRLDDKLRKMDEVHKQAAATLVKVQHFVMVPEPAEDDPRTPGTGRSR